MFSFQVYSILTLLLSKMLLKKDYVKWMALLYKVNECYTNYLLVRMDFIWQKHYCLESLIKLGNRDNCSCLQKMNPFSIFWISFQFTTFGWLIMEQQQKCQIWIANYFFFLSLQKNDFEKLFTKLGMWQ